MTRDLRFWVGILLARHLVFSFRSGRDRPQRQPEPRRERPPKAPKEKPPPPVAAAAAAETPVLVGQAREDDFNLAGQRRRRNRSVFAAASEAEFGSRRKLRVV